MTRMCKEGAKCSAKPDLAMREGQPDAVLMQLCEPSTRQSLNMLLKDSVRRFDRARGLRLMSEHAPSWNKFVEHFHGDDDVVFVDEMLLKYHVRQVNGVNLEPRQRRLAHDPSLQPRNRKWQQDIPEEDQPGHAQRTRSKVEYMQQYVKEQGDTPLCNVNRAEKGTLTLDEEQGEVHSVGRAMACRTSLPRWRWKKGSDHPEHPSHAALNDHASRTRLAKSCGSRDDSLSWNLSRVKQGGAIRVTTWIHGSEGVRWRGGRRVTGRRGSHTTAREL